MAMCIFSKISFPLLILITLLRYHYKYPEAMGNSHEKWCTKFFFLRFFFRYFDFSSIFRFFSPIFRFFFRFFICNMRTNFFSSGGTAPPDNHILLTKWFLVEIPYSYKFSGADKFSRTCSARKLEIFARIYFRAPSDFEILKT